MAEVGKPQRKRRKVVECDFVYDFNCTVCIRKKSAYSEAVKYCQQCNEYFCKPCLRRAECDHDLLGRANVARWGNPSTRHTFDECPRHIGNTLQLYCPTEDVVCCSVCGQSRHKTCGDLKYIPVIASNKMNTSSLKDAVKELNQLIIKVEQLLTDRTTSLNDLDTKYTQIKVDIREAKTKIISLLDNLEQNSLIELDKLKNKFHDTIKSELQLLNNAKTEMQDLLFKLSKPNIDESLQFSRLKQSAEMIRDKKQPISDIAIARPLENVRFVADIKLLDCMKSLQGLGVLISDNHDYAHTKGAGQVSNISQGQGHSGLRLNQPYTVGQKTSFNVKVKGDKATCDIWGMCQLPGGNIMVTDCSNMRLKLLDSTYKVTSHCALSDCPWDVCNTEKGEVAVALNSDTIQFVSVGDKLTATRSFSTRHDCWSLAYHNKCLYIISYNGSTVYVYTPSGSLQHIITTDQHGTALFSDTNYITVSPVSERLYVADLDKGLVTLDLQGNLLATYNPPELQGACAICVDGAGNVFVEGYSTNTVLQVRQEGDKKVAQIVSQSDGISTDKLCFDNVNSRLLVASDDSDTVTVLQLAQ